jgi:hypothetical protein
LVVRYTSFSTVGKKVDLPNYMRSGYPLGIL